MAVATERVVPVVVKTPGLGTLDLELETRSVIVNTGSRPLNPFGL